MRKICAEKLEKTVFLTFFFILADMSLEGRFQVENSIFMNFKQNVDWKKYKIQQSFEFVSSAFWRWNQTKTFLASEIYIIHRAFPEIVWLCKHADPIIPKTYYWSLQEWFESKYCICAILWQNLRWKIYMTQSPMKFVVKCFGDQTSAKLY